jgi:hypothetical protein
MGDLVNLNKARKQRERVKAKTQAAENRIRFGQDKGTASRPAGKPSASGRNWTAGSWTRRRQPDTPSVSPSHRH